MWRARILSNILLTLGLALSASLSLAQETRLPRVGVILNDGPGPVFDALRQGLAELGYVEGRNIVIEGRFAEGHLDRIPELATELVGLNVNVIVSLGAVGAQAARKASTTIPVVFVGAIDSTLGDRHPAADYASYHSHFHTQDVNVRYVVVPFDADAKAMSDAAAASLIRAIVNPDGDAWY